MPASALLQEGRIESAEDIGRLSRAVPSWPGPCVARRFASGQSGFYRVLIARTRASRGGLRVRTHSVRAPGRFPRLRRDRACGQQGSSSESGSLCTCGGALVPSEPSWSSHPDPCVKPHRERSVGAASSPRAAIGAARLPDFRQAGQCLKTWQARDEAWRFWGCKLAYTRIGCSGSTRDGVVPLLWADASREDRGV